MVFAAEGDVKEIGVPSDVWLCGCASSVHWEGAISGRGEGNRVGVGSRHMLVRRVAGSVVRYNMRSDEELVNRKVCVWEGPSCWFSGFIVSSIVRCRRRRSESSPHVGRVPVAQSSGAIARPAVGSIAAASLNDAQGTNLRVSFFAIERNSGSSDAAQQTK